MRLIISIILTGFFQILHAGVYNDNFYHLITPPDSLPPAPPGQAEELTGPTLACVGDVSQYSIDVPVACTCQWTINGVIQSQTGSPLTVTWTQNGPKTVAVVFMCAGGQTSDPETIVTSVFEVPEVFLGNDTTIMQGQTLILDAGNPGSDYLWSTGETTQTLPVSVTGTYSVIVSNFCGADSDTIDVSFYVGLAEYDNKNNDSFNVVCRNGTISFPDFARKEIKIQLLNLSGNVYYDGPPKELKLNGRGIWLIRFISQDKSCYRKILIF